MLTHIPSLKIDVDCSLERGFGILPECAKLLWLLLDVTDDSRITYKTRPLTPPYTSKKNPSILYNTFNGVGANTARMMLSGMSVAELCNAISTGNARLIQSIKGIGKMTAQRIIVDLRDKIVALGIAEEIPAGGQMQAPVNNLVKDEAVSALTMLGFSPAPTQKVVLQILQQQPDLPVEQVVKLALKQIK